MAISINWLTKVITVLQADLTPLGGTAYALDVDTFRLALKSLEDSEEGMTNLMTHNHVAPIDVGGVTLARVIEIINGYTVSFQDTGTPYSVRLDGANNNIADVANLVTNVSIRSNNSAGLVQVSGGSGASAADVWNELVENNHSARELMRLFASVFLGKVSGAGTGTESFRDIDDTKDRVVATVDTSGNRTNIVVDES
jgi:hypothetical protein